MRRGLFIGKFQPYLKTHRMVIEHMAKEVDEIIIGIGSAQTSHELDQPFTAGERVLMISRDLHDFPKPVYVIPIEDIKRNSLWVSHVVSMVPDFSVVYTSNRLIERLFREAGFAVRSPFDWCSSERITQKEWCSLVLNNGDWEFYLSERTRDVIIEIDAVERMIQLSKHD